MRNHSPVPRAAGIVLHPTSLPGRFGIGDLGPAAHAFVDFLARSGQSVWQVLPLGPTGFGDSPYQPFSSFAGNPNLISPEALFEDGLLSARDLADLPTFPEVHVDFGPAITGKRQLLRRAFEQFSAHAAPGLREACSTFTTTHAGWLDDFALFMAIHDHEAAAWNDWSEALALRQADALATIRRERSNEIEFHRFQQFIFFRQWSKLRAHCYALGVRILGDLPIFVALDSADVWAHRELFELDPKGRPTVVAGVPPDYFSKTGQRWGNPLYRWDGLAGTGYAWWIERMRTMLEQVDIVRIDHFRGFAGYWEIPATELTAVRGRWLPGPGQAVFDAMARALGRLPVIAEDLGELSPDVHELREALGFPGMKVLQFAFGGDARDPFLPHNFTRDCVVYTGTHDNDTTRGWYEQSSTPAERDRARRYMGRDGTDITWDMIRLAFASVADLALVPLQDVLDLGSEARMNLPGRMEGNWGWRFGAQDLTDAIADRLESLTALYGRSVDPEPDSAP
jgi:4-alpha-glucanotransferase